MACCIRSPPVRIGEANTATPRDHRAPRHPGGNDALWPGLILRHSLATPWMPHAAMVGENKLQMKHGKKKQKSRFVSLSIIWLHMTSCKSFCGASLEMILEPWRPLCSSSCQQSLDSRRNNEAAMQTWTSCQPIVPNQPRHPRAPHQDVWSLHHLSSLILTHN